MRIYRVRHTRENVGPYQYPWSQRADLCEAHQDCSKHPAPFYPRARWVYGFDSMESLISWFYDWLEPLSAEGFYIAVYEVASFDVREEPLHVSFNPTFANQVESIRL